MALIDRRRFGKSDKFAWCFYRWEQLLNTRLCPLREILLFPRPALIPCARSPIYTLIRMCEVAYSCVT